MKTYSLILSATIGMTFLMGCSNTETNKTSEDEKDKTEAKETAPVPSVDLAASTVGWKCSMMKMYAHNGHVKLSSASVDVENGKVVDGDFVVDMTTIIPLDDNFNPEKDKTKEKLVNHLSSAEFFEVAKYPTAKFDITKVSADGREITGNLTVRGKTQEETVKNVTVTDEHVTGNLTFNRMDYGVDFKSTMTDMVIDNKIDLEIDLKRN